jgi:hypothetical protein
MATSKITTQYTALSCHTWFVVRFLLLIDPRSGNMGDGGGYYIF